jgi:hypothetical protein
VSLWIEDGLRAARVSTTGLAAGLDVDVARESRNVDASVAGALADGPVVAVRGKDILFNRTLGDSKPALTSSGGGSSGGGL